MASGQTTNSALNQWAPEDKVLREEFNQDNAKIDTALNSLGCVAGFYKGDGTAGRLVELGFQPSAVLIVRDGGVFNHSGSVTTVSEGALAVKGRDAKNYSGSVSAAIAENGFQVWSAVNAGGNYYHYVATK